MVLYYKSVIIYGDSHVKSLSSTKISYSKLKMGTWGEKVPIDRRCLGVKSN